jgi:hypothetical protein
LNGMQSYVTDIKMEHLGYISLVEDCSGNPEQRGCEAKKLLYRHNIHLKFTALMAEW